MKKERLRKPLGIITSPPPHFNYETKRIAYDVIDVNLFPRKLTRVPRKKGEQNIPTIPLKSRKFLAALNFLFDLFSAVL